MNALAHLALPVVRAAAGSVVGREHLRLFRNNQDAVVVRQAEGLTVAVVADGCSSAAHSETGAQLGARWLVDEVHALASEGAWDALPERACDRTRARMAALAASFGGGATAFAADSLLFSLLCAVMTPTRSFVFGIGDGVIAIDDTVTVIDSGPGNAPPYLGYRLLPTAPAADVRPTVWHDGAASRVVIATDGLVPLVQTDRGLGLPAFCGEARTFENRHALTRRLRVAATGTTRLSDDTTLAVLERVG